MSKTREGPDQARSWAIAMAVFVINTLLSGITRASGLLYVALLDAYDCTRMEANLPFTTRNIVRNMCGPLVGAIGQRYGARVVSIVGGVMASVGIIMCAFSSNVVWIIAMWGGIHGCGVALANTLVSVVLNQYFLKFRATASGIALSGACFGTFGFPVALEYLLHNYGLSGTFLFTGAIVMNVIPAAFLLKKPPWLKSPSNPIKQSRTLSGIVISAKNESKSVCPVMASIQEHGLESHTNISTMEKVNCRQNVKNGTSDTGYNEGGNDNPSFMGSKSDVRKACDQQIIEDYTSKPRLRTESIGEISITYPSPKDPSQQEISLYKGIIRVVCDPMFHMISFSFTAFVMMFDPTITVIVDYIRDKGIEEDNGKYLISMMSLGDLTGRLCFGWVTDKEFLSIPNYMLLSTMVQGVCIITVTFFKSFNIMMVLMIVYGLASGAALVMFPILVAKYLTSVQSLAIGFMSLLSGFLSFAVPPLIGYFRDTVGSYDGMFLITGGSAIAVGFLWLLEPLLLKLKFRSKHSTSICITS